MIPLINDLDERKVSDFITPSLQWDVRMLSTYLVKDDMDSIENLPISASTPDKGI